MKNVCAVFVYIYPFYILTIHVTAKVRAFVYHKTPLALLVSQMSKCCTIQPRTDYQEIILFHNVQP